MKMSPNILYKSPVDLKTKVITIDANICINDIHRMIANNENIKTNDFKLMINDRIVNDETILNDGDTFVHMQISIPGGKGGFGSMLRAIGAQIEKTTNREACRDLSGRRLRDINEEKRIKNWIAKHAIRKAEAQRKRKERLERLKNRNHLKCEFNDPEYERNRSLIPETIDDALQYALHKPSSSAAASCSTSTVTSDTIGNGKKRKFDNKWDQNLFKNKKHSLWLGIDDDDDVEDDDGDDENDNNDTDRNDNNINNISNKLVSHPFTGECLNHLTDGIESSPIETASDIITIHDESDYSKNNRTDDNDVIQKNEILCSSIEIIESNNITQDSSLGVHSPKLLKDENESQKYDRSKQNEIIIPEYINIMEYESIQQLESLGLDKLKSALMALGMKCGGTLQQRAERLWSVKGLDISEIPNKLRVLKK